MLDRIPLYPGRVTLTPVSGQTNTYDMVRADSPTQEGTPLNKASLLKDSTATLFGLTDTAVPDEVLGVLSRFHEGIGNEYIWEKSHSRTEYIGTITATGSGKNASSGYTIAVEGTSVIVGHTAPTCNTDTGEWGIAGGQTVSASPDTLRPLFTEITYVVIPSTNKAVKFDSASFSFGQGIIGSNIYVVVYSDAGYTEYTLSKTSRQVVEVDGYVNAPNGDAFPPTESDGFTYTLKGPLGGAPRIEIGSYVGTGTYGASNPNSLTFEFAPKLLIVSYNTMALLWTGGDQGTSLYGNTNNLHFSTSGTTVSWYSTSNAGYQNNANGVTYPYVALG